LVTTIIPKVALPPGIPFTSQKICAPGAAHSDAVNVWSWPRPRLAVAGAMELVAEQVMVTVAVPDFVGSAVLVAAIVTVGGEGTEAGAV